MRKVGLNMAEESKYVVIKKLVETNGNKNSAALKLGCTRLTIDRLIQGYRREGKAFFLHGNRGRAPANVINQAIIKEIFTLYDNKYYDANFTHLAELLKEQEEIKVSQTFLRELFLKRCILSPKATRKLKKRVKQQLEREKNKQNQKRNRNVFKN